MANRPDTQRSRNDATRTLVGFHVDAGYYAIEVAFVREIISPTPLVSVPHSTSIVRGVVDHRGHVVPIVDLRRRFGCPAIDGSRRTKWIIVDVQDRWLGLVVDDVTEVFSASSVEERDAPRLGPDDVARGFMRVYIHERQIVLVLDLEVLARAVGEGGGSVAPPSWKPPSRSESESGGMP